MTQDSIKEFLKSFSSDPELGGWMSKPFLIEGSTVATNSVSLAWVNAEIDGFEKIEDQSRIDAIKNYISKSENDGQFIKRSELVELMSTLPLIDEYNEEPENIYCKTCDGDGVVEWEFEHYTMDHDCPVCDGTGAVTNHARIKTGAMIPDLEETASIGSTTLSFLRIKSLIDAAESLGVEEIEIVYIDELNKYYPITFGLGEARVLLMPMNTHVSADRKISIHQKTI